MKTRLFSFGRRLRERGFTLVETTAVIAITGTLAASALPRLTALGGEARHAALGSAQGALASVATMSHAKFLINGENTQAFEDSTMTLVHGYPAANQATADAAGLSIGYVVYTQGSGTGATTPPVPAGAMSLVPRATAGTARASACYLIYEQASASKPRPTIRLGDNTTPESCV